MMRITAFRLCLMLIICYIKRPEIGRRHHRSVAVKNDIIINSTSNKDYEDTRVPGQTNFK